MSFCDISGRLKVGIKHLLGQQVQHILITGARLPKTQNKMSWCLEVNFPLGWSTAQQELLQPAARRLEKTLAVVLLGELMSDKVSQAGANNHIN